MTGAEFSEILDDKVDKAYSAFYSPVEKNRLIQESTIKTIQDIYRNLDVQEERDKLFSFIKTNSVFIPVSNSIFLTNTASPNISDYSNLFAVKAKFLQKIENIKITNASNETPIKITVQGVNNLRSYENVQISNVNGNFAANGSFFIKIINENSFYLYSDKSLTIPVVGNGDYLSGGDVSRVFYNFCEQLLSDRKIDPYSLATIRYPRFEVANQKLKIYPLEDSCIEISVDYLSTPPYYIDSSDSSINIEEVYPIDLLYDIADTYSNLFAQNVKDAELFNTSFTEIQKNKG